MEYCCKRCAGDDNDTRQCFERTEVLTVGLMSLWGHKEGILMWVTNLGL